ncbi:MAG: hypothetical protein R3C14_02925 [Caldilineaceae bacterium]
MHHTNFIRHIFRARLYYAFIVLLPVLALALMPQSASAAGGTLSDEASCTALGGAWSANICTISSLQIDSGETLQVLFGTTLAVNGPVDNAGVIENLGTFIENSATGVINNGGVINNDGTINNAGMINNSSTGVINNRSTGTINNNSTINNAGTLINDGSINNNFAGTLNNNSGGTITNNSAFMNGGTVNSDADSTFTNASGLTNSGTINIAGAVSNSSTGTITNNATGIINGTIDNAGAIINNGGIFINFTGILNNNAGGVITNNNLIANGGVINNNTGGTIDNNVNGAISNSDVGVINNAGVINGNCGDFQGFPTGITIADHCPPTLNPVVTPNPVPVGGAATVVSGTADALSGIATESCGALDTSTAGVKSVTCTATDNAGNTASATVNYTVEAVGVLVASCGGYDVYANGGAYTAPGWSGTILVGTNGNNTLNGSNGADLILGLGGNDLIKGNGGDDVICGGDGVDLLLGYAGNDYLDGGSGNDVLNGGNGDYDVLVANDGSDTLLDGDGVSKAAGGAGNDTFVLALRKGWRNQSGQPRFDGLAAGYGNDVVGLVILNPVRFLVDITGDERDNPASPQEGNKDSLALAGVIDPTSTIIKFERKLVLSADAEQTIPGEEDGAEYLTEPVGEEVQGNQIFLPVVVN